MEGEMNASGKMRVGYFTQYQVEELHGDETPLQHMTRVMAGATPGAVRAQLGRFGFSGDKATTVTAKLSGGERARLALALITREAPHLLILDEPTNHLDVDAREALVQALNDYEGAVILISHDRHMVELTADRLVLVENGAAADYPGSIDDYIDFVLGRNQPKADAKPKPAKADRRVEAKAREDARALKKAATAAEAESARLAAECSAIDLAMFDPSKADPKLASLPMSELSRRRAKAAAELAAAEERWLEANEQLERLAA
jgi:ATP-binding cassette subfamily F protein 3